MEYESIVTNYSQQGITHQWGWLPDNMREMDEFILSLWSKKPINYFMSKQLKAKFECNTVMHHPKYNSEKKHYEPGGQHNVVLSAVCGKTGEDNQFSEATPFGKIEMAVSAEGAKGFIQEGKKYYVYFEECEDQS